MPALKSAIDQAALLYTKCYCEENVFHLLKNLREVSTLNKLFAVFISNPTKSIPIWCQKSALTDQPVIWDYHVICLAKSSTDWMIFDFDSTLPMPCRFRDYVHHALRPEIRLPPELQRKYRIIPGLDYLKYFASDRSHMKKGEEWLSPPPTSALIRSETETNNLERYIDMTDTNIRKELGQKMKDFMILTSDDATDHNFEFSTARDECLVPSMKRRKCISPHRSPKSLHEDVISLDTFELYKSNPWVCLYSNQREHDTSNDDAYLSRIVRKADDSPQMGHGRSYPPVHARSLVDFVNTTSLQGELLKYESIDLSQFNNTHNARDVVWKASTKLVIPHDAIGISELTKEELSVCSTLRFMPEVYLKIKRLVITASFEMGPFRKRDAQNWFRIDVNKISAIYEWFCGLGWITTTKEEWNEFLEKYQKPF